MKFRFSTSALVFLVAMTMATGAFAQGIFTASPGTRANGRANGYAEEAGGITVFLTTGSIAGTEEGTVVISYGVPITNDILSGTTDQDDQAAEAVANPEPIEVSICSEDDETDDTNVSVNKSKGTIEITVDVAAECMTVGDAINVDNVLLNLVGSGLSSVDATVRGEDDVRMAATSLTVISAVVDPLTDDDVQVGQKLTLTRHTGKPMGEETEFHLVITEPQNNSFAGGQLELEFSGVPEDVEIVMLDAWLMTEDEFDMGKTAFPRAVRANQIPIGDDDSKTATAEDDDTVIVYLTAKEFPEEEDDPATTDVMEPEFAEGFGGELASDKADVVIVRGMIKGADEDDLLPIDLDIQVTVDLGPTLDEDDTARVPRFDSDPTSGVTVIDSSPSQTTLKAPFVTNDGTFETGVAVANMGTGASAQPGMIMFDFYVNDGTKLSYTTSASSPGAGLSANGMLEPGSTWSVLLSQVFPGSPGNGYLIITADFTDGDANVFISDFAGFSVTGTVREVKN